MFIGMLKEESMLNAQNDVMNSVVLHGKRIELGYRNTRYLNPYIENLEELKKEPLQDVVIKSRSGSIAITYKERSTNISL